MVVRNVTPLMNWIHQHINTGKASILSCRGFLSLVVLLLVSIPALGPGAEKTVVCGTVTWCDPARRLLVLQDGDDAKAFQVDLPRFGLTPGERVTIDGVVSLLTTAFPDYPDKPAGFEILPTFEAPTNSGEYYLARVRGYLHPPVTGRYTFWIASDDCSELWLSRDEKPSGVRKIASLGVGRWTESRQWDRHASQQSVAVQLQAGRSYYIEALHLQNIGRDCLAVAWQGPGIQRSVIEGGYLTPWDGRLAGGEKGATNKAVVTGLSREYWRDFFLADFSRLGMTNAGILNMRETRVLDRKEGRLPDAPRVGARELLDSRQDFRRVEMEGYVGFHGSDGRELDLELRDERVHVRVRVADSKMAQLPFPDHSLVRVRGVLEPVRDQGSELLGSILWVGSADEICWLDRPENWSLVAETSMWMLTRTNSNCDAGSWIHTRGCVVEPESPDAFRLQGADSFEGFTSADGVTWDSIGSMAECSLSNRVLVGLAVSSHQTGRVAVVEFDHVRGLPGTVSGGDIGHPGIPGGFEVRGDVWQVRGCGEDMWFMSDQCHMVWNILEGEGTVEARVARFDSADPLAKAALMFRQSTAPDSAWAAMVLMPNSRVGLQSRHSSGINAVGMLVSRQANWLKLVRHRNRLSIRPVSDDPPMSFANCIRRDRPGAGQSVEILGMVAWKEGIPSLTGVRWRPVAGEPSAVRTPPAEFRDVLVQDLASAGAEARQGGYPVRCRIRCVVTFNGTMGGEPLLVVQDASAGCPLRLGRRIPRDAFQVGRLVEVDGNVVATEVAFEFVAGAVASLGEGVMPLPVSHPYDLQSGQRMHCQWIELEGVGRSVNPNGSLGVMTRDGMMSVWFGDGAGGVSGAREALAGALETESGPASFIDAVIKVRGVFWKGNAPMLLAPSADCVQTLEQAPAEPFGIPSVSMASFRGERAGDPMARRVKTTGVVTCKRDGFFVVQDETGGIRVESPRWADVNVGDVVESVGFPSQRSFGPVLAESTVRKTGTRNPPGPVALPLEDVDAMRNGVVVEVEALLLEQRMIRRMQILDLQIGQRAFRATLPLDAGRFPSLAVGSRLRVVGVSQIESMEAASNAASASDRTIPASLEILLRGPGDVVVLERPPWWNWKHTAMVVGIFVTILAAVLLWVVMLRRRVEQRTRELRETMTRLEKETQTSATLAERDRLAGEIHDSLEQGLSAIVMQMEAAARVIDQPAEVGRYVALVRNMAVFSRAEVQHAVWDLQSPMLQNADLGTALRRIARDIGADDPARVEVEITGTPRALPSSAEHHLLRIGQEAITNAIKHAAPRKIHVALRYEISSLILVVSDDGCGFDPDAMTAGSGHFGLQGIRVRARKLQAALTVSSRPGQGTRIEVTVPHAGPNPR